MNATPQGLIESMAHAVRVAAGICRAVQAELVTTDALEKDDRSPVTIADLASQAVVVHLLQAACPQIPVMGEEDSSILLGDDKADVRAKVVERVRSVWPTATETEVLAALARGAATGGPEGRVFSLDPIDGTKGFLRGAQYAVALGLIEDGREVAGVLGCPNLTAPAGPAGVLFSAVRGQGSRWDPLDGDSGSGDVVRVSDVRDPTRIRRTESVEKAHTHRGVAGDVAARLAIVVDPVRMDSQCKYGAVARGDAELYLRIPRDVLRSENVWDHAAGALIVEEAGGRVTDLDGLPLDFGRGRTLAANRGIVATNGHVHDAVLAATRG